MTPEQQAWIDGASLEDLLFRWRFSKVGDPLFLDDTGEYYKKVMFGQRDADPDAWVQASKRIGW